MESQKGKLSGYQFYKSLGEPQYVCAPMVDQSELAFRMLCRKYGTTLAYTPMISSKVLYDQGEKALKNFFSTVPEDRPLIAQFCGNDPETLLQACKYVQNYCDAVDINFGCPQGIAKKGHYGSFLLNEPELIESLVKKLNEELDIPVTCKIRILPDREKTIELAKIIEKAGCSILTVHGRTKEQNKDAVGMCDWDIIKEIKNILSIPVFANGGIYTFEDVQRCIEYTGVDGVMSAEGLLENPALFSGKIYDLDDIALEYLEYAEKYDSPFYFVKSHLFKILHTGLSKHIDLRTKLGIIKTMDEYKQLCLELKERRKDEKKEQKFGWYTRFWDKFLVENQGYNQALIQQKQKEREKEINQQKEQDL